MNERNLEAPARARKPSDMFGGIDRMARIVLENIHKALLDKMDGQNDSNIIEIAGNNLRSQPDAAAFFQRIKRGDLMEFLYIHKIPLNSILPFSWEDHDGAYEYWRQEFIRRGDTVIHPIFKPEEVAAMERIVMQLAFDQEIIYELCAEPEDRPLDPRILAAREKYRKLMELPAE